MGQLKKGHSKVNFRPVAAEVPPLTDWTCSSCSKCIYWQSYFFGCSSYQGPRSNLMFFWRKSSQPATSVFIAYSWQYPIIQELQVCQESCDQSTKCASERQLYKPQKTVTDFHQDFFKVKVFIHLDTGKHTYSVLIFTLDTVTAGFLQQNTE